MIKGIGLDLVEINRISEALQRSSRFVTRILSEKEIALYDVLNEERKVEFLAGRFAAKEAFAKALGTGIGKDCSFVQIEVLKEQSGKPILYFNGHLVRGFITITHTSTTAAAQVILVD